MGAVAAVVVVIATGTVLWFMQDASVDATIQGDGDGSPSISAEAPAPRIDPLPYSASRPVNVKGEAENLFRAAMVDYNNKNYLNASVTLQKATLLNPQAPELRVYLGICYLLTRDTQAALNELKVAAALENNPYSDEAHLYLAQAYYRQKDFINAGEQLEKVKNDPELQRRAVLMRAQMATIVH
jgi:tetratricopeptide (TPR) repeat protein